MIKKIILFIMLLSATAYGETAYVNSEDGLRLRRKPNTEAEILATLPFATEVDIRKENCGQDEDWARVMVDNQTGYVLAEHIQDSNPLDEYEYLGNWHITAYTQTGSPCANGNYPTVGTTIANNWLDFGTEVYIDGIGFRIVEDRGPGWLGSEWCDLYLGNHNSCVAFGSQYHDVYFIK